MATKMTADDRRAWHEEAIRSGGSVLHGGQIHTGLATLPSKGDLATTDTERYEALADLEQRRQMLNDEEARIRSASDSVKSSASDNKAVHAAQNDSGELPEDFPGRKALAEAGYTTYEEVDNLSEEELTAIPGIGSATAAKIIDELG